MISDKACFFLKLRLALTEGIDPIIGLEDYHLGCTINQKGH